MSAKFIASLILPTAYGIVRSFVCPTQSDQVKNSASIITDSQKSSPARAKVEIDGASSVAEGGENYFAGQMFL
jgi:hypothetical protein